MVTLADHRSVTSDGGLRQASNGVQQNLSSSPATEKRVAIIQSAYIPWKGRFDLISRCDEYVILDSAQYVKRHWHNRNRIKTANGVMWLAIPVVTKSRFEQPIDEVEIAEPWAERHWRTLEHAYGRAPHFAPYAPRVRSWYEAVETERLLTRVNEYFLRAILAVLGMTLTLSRDRDHDPRGRRTDRLIDLCRKTGARRYLSGPSARAYVDETRFTEADLVVEWMEYGPYEEYVQIHGPFEHSVSVLDVLFNTGPDAARYIGLSRSGHDTVRRSHSDTGAPSAH